MDSSSFHGIGEFFGSRYCLPVGSGTSGLFLILTALDVKGGKVLLPERVCPNVVLAVLAAGGQPVPVGISSRDYNIAPHLITDVIDDSVKAVLAVSSFGYPADIQGIREAIGSYDVPVIDDACQAYGGTANGVKIGNRGDVGVISFGHAKPVDVKGGGLILSNSEELVDKLTKLHGEASQGMASMIKNLAMRNLMLTGQFGAAVHLAQSVALLNYGMPPQVERQLKRAWPKFMDETLRVRQNLKRIDELLGRIESVILFDYDWSLNWLPWRYSFKASSQPAQKEIIAILRKHGIRTSALYGPVNHYFKVADTVSRGEHHSPLDNTINLKYQMTEESTERLVNRLESAMIDFSRRAPRL